MKKKPFTMKGKINIKKGSILDKFQKESKQSKIKSTPEKEHERVLIKNKVTGQTFETLITDKSVDGKWIFIGGEWVETSSINIVHRFK